MEGFTYLLTDGNAYKIGMTTRTVQERVKELNSSTSSYAKIKIVAYCETSNCRATETKLHKKYDRERITPKREWFMLTEDQVIEIQTFFVIQAEGDLYAPAAPEYKEIKRLEEVRHETERLAREAGEARIRAERTERRLLEEAKQRAIEEARISAEIIATKEARVNAAAQQIEDERLAAITLIERKAEIKAKDEREREIIGNFFTYGFLGLITFSLIAALGEAIYESSIEEVITWTVGLSALALFFWGLFHLSTYVEVKRSAHRHKRDLEEISKARSHYNFYKSQRDRKYENML